jgi:hypothetical protein
MLAHAWPVLGAKTAPRSGDELAFCGAWAAGPHPMSTKKR